MLFLLPDDLNSAVCMIVHTTASTGTRGADMGRLAVISRGPFLAIEGPSLGRESGGKARGR